MPEIASRKHMEAIYALADEALTTAGITRDDIDAVAVTFAPGLIGAVLVGVNFAKAAALAMDKPLVPVHHIRGHIAANYIAYPDLEPPFLCLVVSGGHTLLVDVEGYTKFRILGTTRDDAAGECFDKVARLLGMPYPGGAALDKMAASGDPRKYTLPHTHLSGNPLDMSFSGLKTAAINLIHNAEQKGETIDVPSLCASFSQAVSDILGAPHSPGAPGDRPQDPGHRWRRSGQLQDPGRLPPGDGAPGRAPVPAAVKALRRTTAP